MQSTPAYVENGPSSSDLAALFADLRAADAAIRNAVKRAGALAGSGVSERVEGGPLEWALGMVCRLTGSDRRMIVAAGETVQHLPTVSELWDRGLVTWGQIRAITMAVRRLPIAARAELDAQIAATHAATGVDAFDPDHLVEAVDRAVAALSDPRNRERRERRAAASNYVSVQQDFDGGVTGVFSYDAVTAAIVLNGLDAAAPQPVATGDDHDPAEPTRRGGQYAAALVEMAAEYLAGVNSAIPREGNPTGKARRARPLFIGHVQVSDITPAEGATLELNVRGRLTRVTCATMEVLAQDADFRAVLFDGARPLAVSKKLYADKIPDDIRIAVKARDKGDRFPGSQDPTAPGSRRSQQSPGHRGQRRAALLARPALPR